MLLCLAALPAKAQGYAAAKLKPEELDQLMAPIALYPDELLAQILIASTYPLEVVEGDRWVQAHKDLKGAALRAELDKQAWDDSIKALVQTPDVLANMSKNLDWTKKLGDAVLAQQEDVMASAQRLRAKAYDEGQLASTEQQVVDVQQEGAEQNIIIQPADPEVVYVPYYDPMKVYGEWSYPAYPPYYYPPPMDYGLADDIATGIGFGLGIAVMDDIWDSDFDWDNDDIDINVDRNANINRDRTVNRGDGTRWSHNPQHRQGVVYNNDETARKFASQGGRTREDTQRVRQDFRGHIDQSGQLGLRESGIRQSDYSNRMQDRTLDMKRQDQAYRPRTDTAQRQRAAQRTQMQRTQMQRTSAFSNMDSGRRTRVESNRGSRSFERSARNMSSRQPAGGGGRAGRGGGGGGRRR